MANPQNDARQSNARQSDAQPDGRMNGVSGVIKDRFLIVVLAVMVVGAIIQITLGGVVRVTESGLGCPDWPLCHGSIIPRWEYHTMIEWSHRTAGSAVGLFFIAAVVRVWMSHRQNTFLVVVTTGALVLIGIVGGIGGAVVLSEVEPALRTLHLALAELVVLLALLALASAVTGWTPGHIPSFSGVSSGAAGAAVEFGQDLRNLITIRRITTLAAVLVLVTLLSGSYAVWRGAGAVCPSWPLCGGSIIPESELVWIHAAHRLIAAVATLVALYAAQGVSADRRLQSRPVTVNWRYGGRGGPGSGWGGEPLDEFFGMGAGDTPVHGNDHVDRPRLTGSGAYDATLQRRSHTRVRSGITTKCRRLTYTASNQALRA